VPQCRKLLCQLIDEKYFHLEPESMGDQQSDKPRENEYTP
jgi:hypothetical protein